MNFEKIKLKNFFSGNLIHSFLLFLLLIAVGLSLAMYFKEREFTQGISLGSVVVWQILSWLPLVFIVPLFRWIKSKYGKIQEWKQWALLIITGLLFIGCHFFWFYSVSNVISPFIDVPKTKYGVFPFFFIFWITIDFIVVTAMLLYINSLYRVNTINSRQKKVVESFFVNKGKNKFLLKFSDIQWIEADDYYVKIHTQDGKFLKRRSLKSTLQVLPEEKFIQVHRSTVVNVNSIVKFRKLSPQKGEVLLADGAKRIVSRTYLKNINNLFSDPE